MTPSLVTLAFSAHRLECLSAAQKEMGMHEVIILEEPPETDFSAMLAGEISPEAYLEDKEQEFPEYSRRQGQILQELHQEGKVIVQLEPYQARLLEIHELLLVGGNRAEVEGHSDLREVYQAERLAFKALLAFYTCAHVAPFEVVVAAVRDFAKADAARFRQRDSLRAEAILPWTTRYRRLYVECGYLHLYIVKALRRLTGGQVRLRPTFLSASRSLPAVGRPYPFGPGDLLTLYHIFQVPVSVKMEKLLAARSLIYIQLVEKNEVLSEPSPTPHLDVDILAYRLTAGLSFNDCATLYPEVRKATTVEARERVARYIRKSGAEIKG